MGEAMRALAQYVRLGARGADDTLSFDGKTPSGFFRLQRDGGYVLELTSPPSDAETRRRLLNVCARMNGASNCKATEKVSKEVAKELIDAFDGEVVVVVSGSGLSDPDKVNEMLKRRPRAIHAEQCGCVHNLNF
ncbi:unnamed protein product [Cylicocyclus nassatus]|uniref:Uncharacterized protein n=1 Tax=Cylicocyclus nassatus TaxID=53992 RepID=A0AA36HGY0_CYLNA|nr:unnamed protein product [Cylicocyclus nassatus]